MTKGSRSRGVVALCAALTLVACATTEVTRWAAPPGKEILIGQGGAVETVKQADRDIDIWIEGSPDRPFKILAKAKSTYQYGLADKGLARDAAKRQMVEAAVSSGGDAVVFGTESVESVGTVYMPGSQTTTITPTYRGSYRATTTSAPGVAGSIGEGTIHAYIIKYSDKRAAGMDVPVQPSGTQSSSVNAVLPH
jgi:hypothetical protein